MFPANAGSYVAAWCEETLSYWNIGATCWYSADVGYFNSDNEEENINFSLMPSLLSSPDSPVSGDKPIQMASTFIWPLFNMGCLVWFMLFCLMIHCCYRRWEAAIFSAPCAVYWVTFLLAAPITGEFHYMFSLYLLSPFFVSLLYLPLSNRDKMYLGCACGIEKS